MTEGSASDGRASLVFLCAGAEDFSCVSGVKIQIQLLSGENLHIRDFHRTKVGDIATGISSQLRHRVGAIAVFHLIHSFYPTAS